MATPTAAPPPPSEPSAAARGDPMIRAVEALQAAQHLASTGTPPTTAAKPPASSAAAPDPHAVLAKKEQRLAERQREIEAQRQEVEAQQAALVGEAQAIQATAARRAEYRANPARALEDAGITLEELAETVMRDGQPPPELLAKAAGAEVAVLRRELQERDRRAEEAAREAALAERDEARAEVRADISAVVQADPDRFEMIRTYGDDAEGLVFRAMEAYYRQTGEFLSTEDAAARVERYLDGQVERIFGTRRYGARLKPGLAAGRSTRPGADPMDAAVAELVTRGWTRF